MVIPSTIIQNIYVGDTLLVLSIEEGARCVHCKGRGYLSLIPLFKEQPALYNPIHVQACAEVVNFLLLGERGRVIIATDLYRATYLKNKEKPPLTRFGEYDLSSLHPPQLIDHQLVFFTHDLTTSLPYQVTCPIPYTADSPPIQYQLLSSARRSQ